ncbi:carboxylesterase family protein [Thalassotalea sp. ND16A]|uniref:carboxylesterase family protein n=1 Tax=Thalassotalea sp. ND16A TaxID=1535422 RepID=UPI00051D5E13|nr:carboxylesterase family protein [Thalassotalea sp. ND16A]KGJ87859.1 hypothetical protein ND16A_2773 [Thalassotalea sp. ND16A]
MKHENNFLFAFLMSFHHQNKRHLLTVFVCINSILFTNILYADQSEPASESIKIRTTTSGKIAGKLVHQGNVIEWLGVAYAQPPVDDLRWKATRPALAWDGIRQATMQPQPCPQQKSNGDEKVYIGDEDCLYLNIWRPNSDHENLPVHVYFHGGANEQGSISRGAHQGELLAQKGNMIVVTVQYRLGFLGWLYTNEKKSSNAMDNSGNYGLLDSIQSLKWIKQNISAFGGDPNNVTLGGLSAGAQNIFNLLSSKMATGLFHKAYLQSGIPIDYSLTEAQIASSQLKKALIGESVAKMNAEEIDVYLASVSAKDIIKFGSQLNPDFNGVRDGFVMPLEPTLEQISNGSIANKVPLLIGLTKDEVKFWTCDKLDNIFYWLKPSNAALVGDYINELFTAMVVPAFRKGARLSSSQQWDIYFYQMRWGTPDENGNSPLPNNLGLCAGAFHAIDTSFHFGHWDRTIFKPSLQSLIFTEANREGRKNLSAEIMTRFTSFVHNGNPNFDSAIPWPLITEGLDVTRLAFDVDLEKDSAKVQVLKGIKSVNDIKQKADKTFTNDQKKTLYPLINSFLLKFQAPEHLLLRDESVE